MLSKPSTGGSRRSGKKKNGGLFTKIKGIFGTGSSSSSTIAKTKTREDDRDSLGTVATRTRSRMSMFGSHRESKEVHDAERELEERKSRCLAIQAAKRDPPAVQRLLVDCEFCNPPPKYGRDIVVKNAGLTAVDTQKSLAHLETMESQGESLQDERQWNEGLDQWIKMREWWLTPTAYQQPIHMLDSDLTPDRFYTVFDKLIYQTRPLKHPLNLSEITKILKSGWVGEGSWPNMADNDVWSTSDGEDAEKEPDAAATKAATAKTGAENANGPRIEVSLASPTSSTTASREGTPQPWRGDAGSSMDSALAEVPHVQFSDRPHPRDLTPTMSRAGLPPLERVTSSTGPQIRPVRSAQSSVVSITDSD